MATAPAVMVPAEASRAMVVAGVLAGGMVAAALGGAAPLAFALVALLGFGTLHGISDLALIAPGRRGAFLASYLLLAGAVLALWRVMPTLALGVFLIASMVHFGLEDAPSSRRAERLCRGLLMVAGPALLHRAEIATLFMQLVGDGNDAHRLATALAGVAGVGLVLLLVAWHERRRERVGGADVIGLALVAVLLLPPLIGFSIGFAVLHAAPELAVRMAERGHASLKTYVVAHWPVALGAGLVIAAAGWLLADRIAVPLAMLFAGIAALALPHMVVTPLWRRRPGFNGGTIAASCAAAPARS